MRGANKMHRSGNCYGIPFKPHAWGKQIGVDKLVVKISFKPHAWGKLL